MKLIVAITLLACASAHATHLRRFAVQLPTEADAQRLAAQLNLTFGGKIGELDQYFLLREEEPAQHLHRRDTHEILRDAADAADAESLDIQLLSLGKRWHKRGSVSPQLARQFNDPLVSQQWHLSNLQYPGNDINVAPVWASGNTGRGATVALIDDGLDYTHADLQANFFAAGSYDFNAHRNLPTPDPNLDDYHGTRCAGEVAAAPNNSMCGVGVAYGARVAGIRILSGDVTNAEEAAAINYAYQDNDIYSCSWGPADDGMTVEGPTGLVQAAFDNGVKRGRGGLGSVFVFASGNGGRNADNCNYDGYANSIYVMAIGAIDLSSRRAYYSERCPSQLAVTYSSNQNTGITTSNLGNTCYSQHGGTSAAAPIAAGVAALLLSARPDLTWRDVHNIIRLSAVPFDVNNPTREWAVLPNGLYYSDWHGYGKIDASATLALATSGNYTLLQPPTNATVLSGLENQQPLAIPDGTGSVQHQLTINAADVPAYIERLTISVSIAHGYRGDLRISLTSPSNVTSLLATPRPKDASANGLVQWPFTSVKHWDEMPAGVWTLTVEDTVANGKTGVLQDWQITVWGSGAPSTVSKSLLSDKNGTGWTVFGSVSLSNTPMVCGAIACACIVALLAVYGVYRHRKNRSRRMVSSTSNMSLSAVPMTSRGTEATSPA
ncbi:pheromone processing endoprotease [Sorochytrium milnesiophthora]